MADSISKLYSEIGFKVNQEGLEDAKKLLSDLASEITKYVSAVKALAAEESNKTNQTAKNKKKEVSDTEDANKKIVASTKKKDKEIGESGKEALNTQKKINRAQEQDTKITISNMLKTWRTLKRGVGGILSGLKYGWTTGLAAYKFAEPSLERSINFRDLQFESGISLANFQQLGRLFAGSGIKMTSENLAKDILGIQRNLTNIALGGGVLDSYKLLDIREAARRNDIAGVIQGIARGISRNDIDNSMLVELVSRLGVSNPVEWSMMFRRNPSLMDRMGNVAKASLSNEQNLGIQSAREASFGLGYAFGVLQDQITSFLAPAIEAVSKGLTDFSAEWAQFFKDNGPAIQNSMKEIANVFIDWVKALGSQENKESVKRFLTETLPSLFHSFGNLGSVLSNAGQYVSDFASIMSVVVKTLKPIAITLDFVYTVFTSFTSFVSNFFTSFIGRIKRGDGFWSSLGGAERDAYLAAEKRGNSFNNRWGFDGMSDVTNTSISSGSEVVSTTINQYIKVDNEDTAKQIGGATRQALMSVVGDRIDMYHNLTYVGGYSNNGGGVNGY